MPQTTPERAARWPGADAEAMAFLKGAGFTLRRDWTWLAPRPEMTEREIDAVTYLIEEWDFGGVVQQEAR